MGIPHSTTRRAAPARTAVALFAGAVFVLLLSAPPCAAQSSGSGRSPEFGGRVLPNSRGMPAFSQALPEGTTRLAVKNPFHFKAMAQIRSGPKGKDFVLEGKATKVLWIPDGEYSIFWRGINDLRVNEGRAFTAKNGRITYDDEEEDLLTKDRDDRPQKRRGK